MKAEEAHQILGAVPHCDMRVLHAPGECEYCDGLKRWQALRVVWGIAFTGHEPIDGQLPCPSDAARGTAGAHVWPGNQPGTKKSS